MITFLAPLDVRTGYGINSCQKMTGLLRRGHEVFVRPTSYIDHESSRVPIELQKRRIENSSVGSEWEVLISPPCRMTPTPGKKTVMVTTFECDRPPPQFIKGIAPATEAIIVPSKWNATGLLESGYRGQVYVCPESVGDDAVFKPLPKNRCFTFGAVCAPMRGDGDRKGLAILVDSFAMAFGSSRNVRLRIKVPEQTTIPIRIDDSRIEVIKEDWAYSKVLEFYESIDCFVSASSGEGWGRTLHEAMATGRLSIATRFGGQAEFFSGPFIIRHNVVAAEEGYSFGSWGRPDAIHLANLMIKANKISRWSRKRIGRQLSKEARKFSVDYCAERFESILIDAGAIGRPKKAIRTLSRNPADIIVSHYRRKDSVPKVHRSFDGMHLTNEASGIGDWAILSAVGSSWNDAGDPRKVFHDSDSFRSVSNKVFNSTIVHPGKCVSAWRIQKTVDLGAGHFIQRLHRAFGLPVPMLPCPVFKRNGTRKQPGLVVLHLEPGHHAQWQREAIHPRAREVYPENMKAIENVIKGMNAVQLGGGPRLKNATQINCSLEGTLSILEAAEFFIGIMSGPMHLATGMGCKCVAIVNFPDPREIILPVLKDVPVVETEWFYPQNVHLHQDGEGPLVPKFSERNLRESLNGKVYPFWSDRYLHLGLSEHERSELH